MNIVENITLTPKQQEILDILNKWSFNLDERTIALAGAAGTGKTTLIAELVNVLKDKIKLCVAAPTHKARKVIESKVTCDTTTIQSLLGLRPNTELHNFDPNNILFEILSEEKIRFYKLIIIDESSMINSDLFRLLNEKAIQYNCKIIYTGDQYQLPPVKETISKCFKPTETHKVLILNDIIRQKDGNPVLGLLDAVREEIINKTYNFNRIAALLTTKVNSKDEGLFVYRKEDKARKDQFTSLLLSYYTENRDVRFLAWTNKMITVWNKFIKDEINPSEEYIAVNDLLLGYSTVTYKDEVILFNSEEYKVIDVKCLDNSFIDYKNYYVVVENSLKQKSDIIISEPCEAFFKNLKVVTDNAKINNKWVDYFKFKSNHLSIKDYDDGKFKAKKDIDFGYGLTIHKSQGSTYENVFVHLSDIRRNPNESEMFKLMYVAFTRCSKQLHILV
jgi:exodeoxyribonuclease-5